MTAKNGIWCMVIVVIIAGIPLFTCLGAIPLQLWDESRLATSALELFHTNNILIPTIDGEPDMWSTKPPLLIWIQLLCLKGIGISEFAVRLPSALAGLLICMVIFRSFKAKGFYIAGLVSVIVLVSTPGYVTIHGTRTADYDSLLTLFTTICCLQFYRYIENGRAKHLWLTTMFIILSVLCKGVAGMIFVLPMALYAMYRRKAVSILSGKHFYFALAAFLVTVGGYYILREHYDPGYWNAVGNNELGGRFLEYNDNNVGGRLYYVRNLFTYQYSYWMVFLLLGCGYFLIYKRAPGRRFVLYLVFMSVLFFLVINISRTKLAWYAMPLFPLFAMIVGMFLYSSFTQLSLQFRKNTQFAYIMIGLVCVVPYAKIVERVTHPASEIKSNEDANELAGYLSQVLKKREVTAIKVAWNEYQGPLSFYILAFSHLHIPVAKADMADLRLGDTVILYESEVESDLKNRYILEAVAEGKFTRSFRVTGVKRNLSL